MSYKGYEIEVDVPSASSVAFWSVSVLHLGGESFSPSDAVRAAQTAIDAFVAGQPPK